MAENPYESPTEATTRDNHPRIGPGWYAIAAFEFFAACVGVLCIAFFLQALFVWLVFDRSMREFTTASQPTQSIALWYWLGCCFVAVLLGSLRAVRSLKKSRARATRQAVLVEERLSAVRSLKQRSGLAEREETG